MVPSQIIATKLGKTQLFRMYLYAVALGILEIRDPNMFQHNTAPVHKARSINSWFAKFGVEDDDPDFNSKEHLFF